MNNILNQKSIFRKNYILIIVLIIIISTIYATIIITISNNSVKKAIFIIEQQKLIQTNESVSLYFDQITRINNYFSTIVMREITYPIPEYEINWYTQINDRATICIALLNYIKGIKVISSESEYQKGDFDMKDLQNVINSQSLENVGLINATNIYFINNQRMDCLYFYEDENEYAQNKVIISVNALDLGKNILGDITDNEYKYIVDQHGNIVLTNNSSFLQDNIFNIYSFNAYDLQTGSQILDSNKQAYYFSVNKIKNTDLYTVSFTKTQMYSEYRTKILFQNIMFGLLLIVIFILLSSIVVIITYNPINRLIKSLSSYFPENYLNNFVDEISYIESRIKELHSENSNMNILIKDDMFQLRNQQIMALQAQISPHFIYNTLDVINWISYKLNGKDNQISKCVLNMAYLLKSSMRLDSMLSSLDKEIEITKKYIEILKIRYFNSFDVIWEIDESLLDAMVPKICMQPVVENAVFHGISQKKENGIITIKIYFKQEHFLCIVIEDNGQGIAIDNLQLLQDNINNANTIPASHIGLRNVNLRLKLLYGDEYGLTIDSKENEGCTCTMLLFYENN